MSSCQKPFKKAKDGSLYKVISNGKGIKAKVGNFLEFEISVKYNDSILMDSREEAMPQFAPYDTAIIPSPFKEAFNNLRVGDSIVIKISTDSMIAKGNTAPFMKKGQFIFQTLKLTNLYSTKDQKDSAQKTHIKEAKERAFSKKLVLIEKDLTSNKAQIEKDSKIIENYLSKNNMKARKTKWGTYISIINEGVGSQLTNKDVATVYYSGHVIDSTNLFDSNIDPKFNHTQPYDVSLGDLNSVIWGWTDALLQMKKGTKAQVIIPSSLGYGKLGREPSIGPDKILIFDIEVTDAMSEEAKQLIQEATRKKMMDSLRNIKSKIKEKSITN
jgi:hypothetical protein